MSEPTGITHLETKRKSKKIKKSYNLFDFVVVKTKNKKTQQTKKVKATKAFQKRGKVRKKKVSAIKKRIIRERTAKHSLLERTEEVSEDTNLEKVAQVVTLLPDTAQNELTNSLCEGIEEITLDSKNNESIVQHSRNFRDYCNHFITHEIKHLTELVLKDLFKFQENKFQQNPGNFL